MTGFTVLQITDCHIGDEPNDMLLGMDTDNSLRDVLADMQRDENPDMLLVTGDISKDGGSASYARFLRIVNQYFPDTPLAWLAGNHDNHNNMISVASYPIEYHYNIAGWHMIFLDSCVPGMVHGELGKPELDRLRLEIEAHPNQSIAVFLHHQPVAVNCKWVDVYVLADDQEFWEIIDAHENVKIVSWGHIHQHFEDERNHVQLMSTPSTCVQFSPYSDEFSVDTLMPGYRRYDFKSDGTYSSEVRRTAERVYQQDYKADGY